MGASLAYALRGFRGARITGADVQDEVCRKAEKSGAVDQAYTDAGKAIEDADLIIFCVYARHIPALVKENLAAFKPGAVVSDICGVKSALYAELTRILPQHIDYIGVHPMAGKERDGFDNADKAIFKNSGFILCPLPSTSPEAVELMREAAEYIGATHFSLTSCSKHDEIIAYTSNLMHMAAAGLCLDFHPDMTSAFTAGAFRDCTRIADINAGAWTELLLSNREQTRAVLDRYIANLQKMSRALAETDEKELYTLLEKAGTNKREMLRR